MSIPYPPQNKLLTKDGQFIHVEDGEGRTWVKTDAVSAHTKDGHLVLSANSEPIEVWAAGSWRRFWSAAPVSPA